ncbi:MAG: hypothetical protein ACI8S7_001881, partial [Candidatus Krumholzibacteriia bacterium]
PVPSRATFVRDSEACTMLVIANREMTAMERAL